MVVVDASAVIAALVDSGQEGRWAESIIADGGVAAPELMLVETTDVLRHLEHTRVISTLEANSAYRDLLQLDFDLFEFDPFAQRIWDLRSNLTIHDAWYVAVAEALDCPLATLDGKLSRANGPRCEFVLPPSVVNP